MGGNSGKIFTKGISFEIISKESSISDLKYDNLTVNITESCYIGISRYSHCNSFQVYKDKQQVEYKTIISVR